MKIGKVLMLTAAAAMLVPVTAAATSSIDGDLYAGRGRRARSAKVAPAPKKPMQWVYMSQRMAPPKSDKWAARWNELGLAGWKLVGQQDKYYIFMRPADYPAPEVMPSAPVATESAPADVPLPEAAPKKRRYRSRF